MLDSTLWDSSVELQRYLDHEKYDWIDIEKIIIRQGNKLDRNLIMVELEPLVQLKEEPEILDQLTALFERHSS